MRLLVDADVVLEYLDDSQGLDAAARKLMILGYLGEFELWMSAAQAADLFSLLASEDPAEGSDEAKRVLRHIRHVVRICSLTEADVDAVLDSAWDDFGRACVFQCALKLKADAIVARSQEDFQRSSIKVFDCDGLFAYMAEEKGLVFEEIFW